MQTLDVQVHTPSGDTGANRTKGPHGALLALLNGESGAETARNGTSFLAIIQKMLAGSREGLDGQSLSDAIREAGRGAGNQLVPGELDTLIKPGSAGRKAAGSNKNREDDALAALFLSGAMTGAGEANAGVDPQAVEQRMRDLIEAAGDGSLPSIEEAMHKTASAANGPAQAEPGSLSLTAMPLQKADPRRDGPDKDHDADLKSDRTERRERSAVISLRDERMQMETNGDRIAPLSRDTPVRDNGDGSADMSITFRTDGSRSSQGTTTTSLYANPAADGESFSALLAKEIREGAQDFVRAGQIVLRDNNTGTIRLTLHPETLGNVRISLELGTDRKISGRIVVESKEAYDAFNENLDVLSEAFREGGFDTAGFNLSWSGQDQAGYAEEQQAASVRAPFYAQSIPDVMSGTETADRVMSAYRTDSMRAVNLFA